MKLAEFVTRFIRCSKTAMPTSMNTWIQHKVDIPAASAGDPVGFGMECGHDRASIPVHSVEIPGHLVAVYAYRF